MKPDQNSNKSQHESIGDSTVGTLRENRDFFLKLFAGAITPFGSILTAPQATALLTGNNTVSAKLLAIGITSMMIGLIIIPIALWKMEKNNLEKGIAGKFVKRVDECISAMAEYSDSERTDSNKKNMIQKITTEAINIIGHDARVCVYRWVSEDADTHQHAYFELEEETRGDRNPQSQARPKIGRDDGESGVSFMAAMEQKGQRVIVQNISKPTPGISLDPNPANGYSSFILSPIKSQVRVNGKRPTIGVLTVDFPRKKVISKEMVAVVAAFTEMFAVVYQQANNQPFPATSTKSQAVSPLRTLVPKGDDHDDHAS